MQLTLILGILAAIGAVLFALQNNAAVTVTLALWQFEGSLALVLLIALGLGALIAGLISSPTVIRSQWSTARLGRQLTDLEHQLRTAQQRNEELATELTRLRPEQPMLIEAKKPYVGLKTLITGSTDAKPPPQ